MCVMNTDTWKQSDFSDFNMWKGTLNVDMYVSKPNMKMLKSSLLEDYKFW